METHTLNPVELRQAIAQYLYDNELTTITDGTMELTIYDDNSVQVQLHEDIQVH